MSVVTASEPAMARKKPGPVPSSQRDDASAKIDKEVMHLIRLVATARKQSIAEYLSETMARVAGAEWEKIRSKPAKRSDPSDK